MSDLREEWRPIPGMPYEASDFGNVRRVGSLAPLAALRMPSGYRQFAPSVDGKPWRVYIHRAVALAFFGPCPDEHEVNHKNGCKSDNRPENLEYVTRSGNMRHAHDTGLIRKRPSRAKVRVLKGLARGDRHWMHMHPERVLRGEQCGSSKLTADIVLAIRAAVAAGEMQSVVADRFGVSRPRVCRIVNREQWRHL